MKQSGMKTYLVRYGAVPEVARFGDASDAQLERNERVVVQSPRGLELGTVLQALKPPRPGEGIEVEEPALEIVRPATSEDLQEAERLQSVCQTQYAVWMERIREWKLELELIDLEFLLDSSKLVLYVLTGRGPDSTKLALQAAAAGIVGIEVQPVSAEGLVQVAGGGGCGSGGGGCGSGGCGS